MGHPWRIATVALLLAAAVAAPAAAQSDPPEEESLLGDPPPADPPPADPVVEPGDGEPLPEPAMDPELAKAMARKLVEGGDEFFKKGDYYVRRKKPKDARERYERAFAAYSKAFELAGDPLVYYPLATSEEKLERWLDAAIHYHRFLADAPAADAAQRDRATARLDALKLRIGLLTLAIQPEGAAVAIDGAPIGAAPLADPIFLAPGDHTLSITADGYQASEQKLVIEAGSEAERTYELEPVPAVIVDRAPPPPPPPPPPALPPGPSRLPIVLGGGVALGLAGGAVATGLMAMARHDVFLDEAASPNRRENARTEGKNLALITDALIAGSLVAVGVTTYYYLEVYKPKARSHDRKRRERAGFVDELAGGAQPAPKLLLVPWVEASGPATAAGLVLGGAL